MEKFNLDLYNAVTSHALKHGEDSEPDHEVGDLQDTLRECLEIMTLPQARKLYTRLSDEELIA
jgi:hypothetical protein